MPSTRIHDISIFAMNLALQAGELIETERRNNQLQVSFKSHDELVTSADLKVDQLITKAIQKTYPGHRILSEELSPDYLKSETMETPLWIVDPIDGTVNFAHGHPQVAVSIAYAERGEIQIGVVHCPFLKETFHAIKGEGATLNHKRISVSQPSLLSRTLIATGFPYHKDDTDQLTARLNRVLKACRDIRRNGSAAIDICWVSCGRLDGYYESLSPWDFAAAKLIAEEAGAFSGHFSDVPEGILPALYSKDILIAAPKIFDALKKICASD